MASLPQMSAMLGAYTTSNKIINARPSCIAQLNNNNNNKSTHFNNLVANHQIANATLFPLALVGLKKPVIELLWKKCQNEKWKARARENPYEFLPHSLIKTAVEEFYHAFNEKDIEQLGELISDDCEYQDYLFYSPCKGKDKVIEFWESVMEAMGPNIKVSVRDINVKNVGEEEVKEGKLIMATVLWHLEWGADKRKLPFTKGCRFFLFKEDEGRLIISKITGMEEFPLKPGELVLNMLRAIRTFLDSYPPIATALLNNPAFRDD